MPPTLADRLEQILVAIDTIQNALANKRVEDLGWQSNVPLKLSAKHRAEFPTT